MDNRRVLISGLGIAGPTPAFWLRRHGYIVTLVERAPAPRRGGMDAALFGSATSNRFPSILRGDLATLWLRNQLTTLMNAPISGAWLAERSFVARFELPPAGGKQ